MSLALIKTLIHEILIQEKRRLPIENRIKEESTKILDKYVDKEGYYFHFTDDYNLQGLNVRGVWDTPMGIYVYPLVYQFYNNEKVNVPFAGDRKYIIIYKEKTSDMIKSSTYSFVDLKKDVKKLGFDESDIEKCSSKAKIPNNPMSILMYFLYADKNLEAQFSHFTATVATNRLKNLGYAGMYDDRALGVIHENEPLQAFFIGTNKCEIVDVVINPSVAKNKNKARLQQKETNLLLKKSPDEIIQEILDDSNKIFLFKNNIDALKDKLQTVDVKKQINLINKHKNDSKFKYFIYDNAFVFDDDVQIILFNSMNWDYSIAKYSNNVFKSMLFEKTENFLKFFNNFKIDENFFLDKDVQNKFIEIIKNTNLNEVNVLVSQLINVRKINDNFKQKIINVFDENQVKNYMINNPDDEETNNLFLIMCDHFSEDFQIWAFNNYDSMINLSSNVFKKIFLEDNNQITFDVYKRIIVNDKNLFLDKKIQNKIIDKLKNEKNISHITMFLKKYIIENDFKKKIFNAIKSNNHISEDYKKYFIYDYLQIEKNW